MQTNIWFIQNISLFYYSINKKSEISEFNSRHKEKYNLELNNEGFQYDVNTEINLSKRK